MKMEQKKVTVNEVEYTLQKLPVRHALKMQQRFSNSDLPDGINTEIACDECFANIVVNPKVTLDEFDYIEDAVELMAECVMFQYAGEAKERELQREVKQDYDNFWGPLLILIKDKVLTYTEAMNIDEDELIRLLVANDMYNTELQKALKARR